MSLINKFSSFESLLLSDKNFFESGNALMFIFMLFFLLLFLDKNLSLLILSFEIFNSLFLLLFLFLLLLFFSILL